RKPDVVRVLDRVHLAIGGAEAEEDAETAIGIAAGIPQVLVEVVVDRPRVVLGLRGLHRHQELGEEPLEDAPEDRAGIYQERKSGFGERARDVAGVLIELEALLVAPVAADELMADEPERPDGHPALRAHQHAIVERLAEIVAARSPTRIHDADGGECVLPW